jgi:tol-pal system protein YbgF
MSRSRPFLVVALALLPLASPAADKGAPADPARREALADMLLQLEQVQAELRELRGKVEVQAHEIEALKARSRDLLADIDRRLSEVERRGSAPAAVEEAARPGTPPVAEAAVPAEGAIANLAREQQEYDAALALLRQGQYGRAEKRFREFVAAHPKSPLAGLAQYWIGESAYVVRNFKQALVEFSRVMQDYPDSPKVPASLLKIGHTYYELEDWGKARETLNQVVVRYPNTPEARLAEQRLAKMKEEGR